jgi:AcrR family transcriptional regulator
MMKRAEPERKQPGARERILGTAHELFYRDGVRATGVDKLIAAAGVTKATFYRHFHSKDDLIKAFLEYRHVRWMGWFTTALARHQAAQSEEERRSAPLAPLHSAVAEWLLDPDFRGCAFINTVSELAGAPTAAEIAARHKEEMTEAIAGLLPPGRADAMRCARAASLAVDGAIVRAQTGASGIAIALDGLREALAALTADARRRAEFPT